MLPASFLALSLGVRMLVSHPTGTICLFFDDWKRVAIVDIVRQHRLCWRITKRFEVNQLSHINMYWFCRFASFLSIWLVGTFQSPSNCPSTQNIHWLYDQALLSDCKYQASDLFAKHSIFINVSIMIGNRQLSGLNERLSTSLSPSLCDSLSLSISLSTSITIFFCLFLGERWKNPVEKRRAWWWDGWPGPS